MRTRALLAFLLVAALGWWFWLRSRPPEDVDPRAFAAAQGFESAVRLVFRDGGDSVVVVRDGDRFRVTRPFEDLADENRIRETLRDATQLEALRVLPDADPTGFGLRPARRSLRLETADGASWELAFGDSVPVAGGVYARVLPSSPVLVLREFGARRSFYPGTDALRDPVALPLDSPVLDSLEVRTRVDRFRAVRESRERWVAREPAGVELDPLPINRTLRQLRGRNLTGFEPVGADLAPRGLAPPRATWIVHQAGRVESLRIGNPTADQREVYVLPSGRDHVARIPSDFYRDMVDGWPRFANRRLLDLGEGPIESVRFLGTEAAYVRGDGGWTRLPGERPVAAPAALDRDLENLRALQWAEFPAAGGEAPAPRAERIALELRSAAAVETLVLARAEEDSVSRARSSRRPLWGPLAPTYFTIWSYRRDHPEM